MRALRDRIIKSFRSGQGPGARMLRGLSHASLITVIGLPIAFAKMFSPQVASNLGPSISSILIYVLMAAVLFLRPQGLFPARG